MNRNEIVVALANMKAGETKAILGHDVIRSAGGDMARSPGLRWWIQDLKGDISLTVAEATDELLRAQAKEEAQTARTNYKFVTGMQAVEWSGLDRITRQERDDQEFLYNHTREEYTKASAGAETPAEEQPQDVDPSRDAQIGRAVSVLQHVWNESGDGTEKIVEHIQGAGGDVNHWNDVLRWIASGDEPTPPPVDFDEDNRWSAFSIYELQQLVGTATMSDELIKQLDAEIGRQSEEETYQGPGRYTDVDAGTTLNVIGKVTVKDEGFVLVGRYTDDPNLWAFPLADINERYPDGRRRFEFR